MDVIHAKLESLEKEILELKKMLRSKERFIKSAGKWHDLDTEKLCRGIYESRSRPSRC
jgi:hypothetical protein